MRPERFARLATDVVVRRPLLWRFLRRRMRRVFDGLAPRWDEIRSESDAVLEAALAAVAPPPPRVLDLGSGTGIAAVAAARRWPEAAVVGIDLSDEMVAAARRKLPPELADRVAFEPGDAAALPFADASFELVVHANMLPFFDELARVTAFGGHVVFAFSRGAGTPIYVPPERLRSELERRSFGEFRQFAVGDGVALLARRRETR